MKTIFIAIILVANIFAQSRVTNRIQDNPIRNYKVYAEIKTDTSTSVLKEDLDVLKTNVESYLVNLENQTTSGDTTFGEFDVPVETVAYIKIGVVVVSATGKKPSLMRVSKWWKKISAREPKVLNVFVEEK